MLPSLLIKVLSAMIDQHYLLEIKFKDLVSITLPLGYKLRFFYNFFENFLNLNLKALYFGVLFFFP